MIRRSTTAADFADGAAAEPAATAAAAGAGTANVQTADIAAGGAVAAEKAGVPAAGASGRPTGFRMRPSLRPHAVSTVVAALHLPTVALSERRSPRLRARKAPAMKGTEAKTAAVRGIAAVAAAVAAEKAATAKHLKRLPAAEAAERRNRCRPDVFAGRVKPLDRPRGGQLSRTGSAVPELLHGMPGRVPERSLNRCRWRRDTVRNRAVGEKATVSKRKFPSRQPRFGP